MARTHEPNQQPHPSQRNPFLWDTMSGRPLHYCLLRSGQTSQTSRNRSLDLPFVKNIWLEILAYAEN